MSCTINSCTHPPTSNPNHNKSFRFLPTYQSSSVRSCALVARDRVMAGNKQRKSSFFSVFNVFKSNSNKHRGGGYHYDAYEEGRTRKVYPSDEDRGRWGVADPSIDIRAADFIAQYKKKVTESETHWQTRAE